MATITVPNGYNIWKIVALSGVSPVIVEGDNMSYSYENGELTVPEVTQEALEQGLADYDHDAYLASIVQPPSDKDRIALLQDAVDFILMNY